MEQLVTGKRWVCVLCKELGLSVEQSLTQCAVGDVSNANKHLSKHTDRIAELDREQVARLKGTKRKAKSYKSTTLETSDPTFTVSKKQKRRLVHTTSDGLDKLVFNLVNNGGHSQKTVIDDRLRQIIDYCITNANQLHGHQHMGDKKFIRIQASSFQELLDLVSNEITEIREWYITNTVRQMRRNTNSTFSIQSSSHLFHIQNLG